MIDYLSIRAAVRYLHARGLRCSERTLRRHLGRGTLTGYRPFGERQGWLINVQSLDSWRPPKRGRPRSKQ